MAGSQFPVLHSRYSVVCLAAFALLVAGCAARRPIVPRPAPATLPSVADLEATLTARCAAVRSLRALARLRYRDPQESSNSREAIVVARPDRLRIEVLSLFGSVFVMTTSNGAITAWARQDGTVYRGPASPENLSRYARLWMPVSDLVDIMLGTPPLPQTPRAQVSFDADAGYIRLQQPLDGGSQAVWFSEAQLPVAAERRGADGRVHWRTTFAAYEDHGGVPIATHIALELPAWSQSAELSLEDIDVNPTLDSSIFALQTPPGSKVVELDPVAD